MAKIDLLVLYFYYLFDFSLGYKFVMDKIPDQVLFKK